MEGGTTNSAAVKEAAGLYEGLTELAPLYLIRGHPVIGHTRGMTLGKTTI